MSSSTNNGVVDSVTSTISQTAQYVSDTASSLVSGASKEANKETVGLTTFPLCVTELTYRVCAQAKDSNQSIGTRASAAMDAGKDKMDEEKNSTSASAHKSVPLTCLPRL